MEKRILTQAECHLAAKRLRADYFSNHQPLLKERLRLYGVPRGGVPVAYLVGQDVGQDTLVGSPADATLIVDDIVDSGRTRDRYHALFPETTFLALADYLEPKRVPGQWIVFPWERSEPGSDTSADDVVIRLLQYIGEDPVRDGLKDTPKRVLKAWKELTVGYSQDPGAILEKSFEIHRYDQVIACSWIEFYSMCEHHMLPFSGYAHVAYLPAEGDVNGVPRGIPKVVGLSKLARLVECFARRLQVQERMTEDIAHSLEEHLRPRGVAVVIQAKHLCMACRGVEKHKSVMVTSAMRGVFRDIGPARAEFFQLIELAQHSNGL